jgi:methyl-accepting chemotaxis protein
MGKGMTIKNRILVLGIGVFLASALLMGLLAYRSQVGQLRESLKDLAKNESRLFHTILAGDAEGLTRAHIGLTRHGELLRYFGERKREELMAAARSIFFDMKSRNNITHMYFIDPDGTVFLRVHKPEQYGDRLQRATFLKARETGKVASGIEMGKNFFSLRTVHPIPFQGTGIAYLEVAEEIDHVFSQMKEITGNNVSLLLTEEFLQKAGAEVDKEEVGKFTVLESTGKEEFLALARANLETLEKGLGEPVVAIVDLAGKKFVIGVSPVEDAAGNLVGVLFSEKEVTPLFAALWQGIFTTVLIFAGIFLGSALILFLSLRRGLKLFDQLNAHMLQVTTSWDLTGRLTVETGDEIAELGNNFNTMTAKLEEVVGRVGLSSRELAQIAGDIRGASRQVVGSAEQQAENVTSTVSAVTEISASVQEVGSNVDSLSSSAEQTSSSITEMAVGIEESAANIDQLASAVEEVSSSIAEMTAALKEIGNNVSDLLEASNMTASSVVQMDATIRQVEKNAADSATLAARVREDAERGKASSDATIAGIGVISESTGITAGVVDNLSSRVKNIGGILSVIDDVTEQTSLLALNAAIIAAQAGESGKGFAVVADEIKQLADRTRNSTREIASVIEGIQAETRLAVDAIGKSEKAVKEGEALSLQSGQVLEKIVGIVENSAAQADEIARAMVEQAVGSQMIRKAMEKVSDLVIRIDRSNREQEKAGDQIVRAVERMRDLNGQVRSSARGQTVAGRQIAQATENVAEMIRHIKRACDEQETGSRQIMQAVENIRLSTERNLEAVRILDGSLDRLTGQADGLHDEIGRFKTRGSGRSGLTESPSPLGAQEGRSRGSEPPNDK